MSQRQHETESEIDAVFVYGTLKHGQCRAGMWPHPPMFVDQAWVHGQLFGRSDYPAMRPGSDRIQGEYWQFSLEVLPDVLRVLDQIEGTNQSGGEADVYHRIVLEVFRDDGSPYGKAFAYVYASDPLEDGFHRVVPSPPEAKVSWP